MSENAGGRGRGREDSAVMPGGPVLIKISPAVAEENLFRKLPVQILPDSKIEEILRGLTEVGSGPDRVAAIVHVVMRQYLAGPLGYIIPPTTGSSLVKDRITQAIGILFNLLRNKVEETKKNITEYVKYGKNEEVEKSVRELVEMHLDMIVAAREIMNRFLTLYAMNLPARFRPPLMHIKLGMDIHT